MQQLKFCINEIHTHTHKKKNEIKIKIYESVKTDFHFVAYKSNTVMLLKLLIAIEIKKPKKKKILIYFIN